MKKWQFWPKNVITQIFQRPYNLISILVLEKKEVENEENGIDPSCFIDNTNSESANIHPPPRICYHAYKSQDHVAPHT